VCGSGGGEERRDVPAGVEDVDGVECDGDHHSVQAVEENLGVVDVGREAFRECDRTVDVTGEKRKVCSVPIQTTCT